MKLSEAFSRYKFQVTSGNKPNEKDIEAFNVIAEYLQKVQEETIQDNLLFAKLYMYLLGKLVSYYNNADEANKHIGKILSQKTDNLIGILEMELRAMELRQVLPDPVLNVPSSQIRDKLAQYPKFEEQFLVAWDFWDFENVKSHINTQINLSLHEYKNHI